MRSIRVNLSLLKNLFLALVFFVPVLLASEAFSASHDIEIRAKGDQGQEVMTLTVNDQKVRTWRVSDRYKIYRHSVTKLTKGSLVQVAFTNDQWPEDSGDYNLSIDWVRLNGEQQEAEAQKNDTGGREQTIYEECIPAFTDFLACNGYIEFVVRQKPTNHSTLPNFALPIEVLSTGAGDNGLQTRTFNIDALDGSEKLWVRCHRCAYHDASVRVNPTAKGSYRINKGTWIAISSRNIRSTELPEKDYGGLDGGFATVDIVLPANNLTVGRNTIEFRFNGTDGLTNGYRIVSLQIKHDGYKNRNIAQFKAFDSSKQGLPLNGLNKMTRIEEGRTLWNQRNLLKDSPIDERIITASCADCHAKNGRDLKYFGFSNASIIKRSQFHGLTEFQGKKIANYVRSQDVPTPKNGRPWNPPYQPGVNIDSKALTDWSAGAGLAAVLEKDEDVLPFLIGTTRSQSAIDKKLSIKQTLNLRELPIPFQLPDWMAWLPTIHPLDIWTENEFEPVLEGFNQANEKLGNSFRNRSLDKPETGKQVESFRQAVNSFATLVRGPKPCKRFANFKAQGKKLDANTHKRIDNMLKADRRGFSCEQMLQNLNQWHAVRNWELHEQYGLSALPRKLYRYGEKRGWLGSERGAFDIAAHRSANNSNHFSYQSKAVGAHHSNAWYYLQAVVNAGYRDQKTFTPQDWFYTGNWAAISARDNQVNLAATFTALHLKMMQNLDLTGPDGLGDDAGPNKNGWWIQFVHPWRLYDRLHRSDGFPLNGLDEYGPSLRRKVLNSLLQSWLDKTSSYRIKDLPRYKANGPNPTELDLRSDFFEPYRYTVDTSLPKRNAACYFSCPGQGYHARDFYLVMKEFKRLGVDDALRDEMIDWLESVWPESSSAWDAVR